MNKEKSDGKQAAGLLPINVELLHQLLRLPAEVRIVCAVNNERQPGIVTLRLAGGDLPCGCPGEDIPEVTAVYEAFHVPTFVRFERIDDEQNPRPQPA